MLCRQQGRHLATELLGSGACPSRPSGTASSSSSSEAGSRELPESISLLLAPPPEERPCFLASVPAAAGHNGSSTCGHVQQWQPWPGINQQEWLLVTPLGVQPGAYSRSWGCPCCPQLGWLVDAADKLHKGKAKSLLCIPDSPGSG